MQTARARDDCGGSFDRFVTSANSAADRLARILGPLFWAALFVLFLAGLGSAPR